jgi:transcriptional regulatory protein AMDR
VKDIRDALVDAHFDQINPYFPVIDEFDFHRRYEDPTNPPLLIILQSVILAGAHECSHPKIAESRAVVTATLFSAQSPV